MDPNAPSSGDHAAAAIPNPISCHPYFHPPATFYISQEDVSLRHAFFDLASATPEPLVAYRRAGPRGGLAVDPARAALVTCGGLCPGLNTVLRELVVGYLLWEEYDSDDENGFAEEAGDKDMDDSFMESYSDALNKELRRVYKGKKMPGRMGGTKNKIRKLKIVKIDDDLRVLMIKGAVPGKPGNLLRIAPAKIVGNNIPKN